MADDPILTRRYITLTPEDTLDPPRFGQPTETVKDGMLQTIRLFLQQQNAAPGRKTQELPTFRKYALGYGPGTNPFETFSNIVQEYPDVLERLPHVAVLSATGTNHPMNVGRPQLGPTWLPPRIVGTVAGPFSFANPTRATWTFTVTAAVNGFVYGFTMQGVSVSYTAVAGDTINTIAFWLQANAQQTELNMVATFRLDGPVVTIEWNAYGEVVVVGSVSANLTATNTVLANAGVNEPQTLTYRTKPWLPGRVPEEETTTVVFWPDRFPTGTIATASAAVIAGIINEQSRYASASAVPVGVGTGVRLTCGGKLGGAGGPNQIEVVDDGGNTAAQLGLAYIVNGAGADAFVQTGNTTTLTVAGAAFTPAMVGQSLTITGAPSSVNDGTYTITAVTGSTQLQWANPVGVSESAVGVRFFVSQYDDSTNPARLAQNRFVQAFTFNVSLSIYAESANERTELVDLVLSQWSFWLEDQFFAILGRGFHNYDAYPYECYQITVSYEVTYSGEADFLRPGGDGKDRIYEGRISVPVMLWWYLDRQVVVPSGPDAGDSWVLNADDVSLVGARE